MNKRGIQKNVGERPLNEESKKNHSHFRYQGKGMKEVKGSLLDRLMIGNRRKCFQVYIERLSLLSTYTLCPQTIYPLLSLSLHDSSAGVKRRVGKLW